MDDWLLLQSGYMLYGALFVFLLGGAVGLPIPEDLPLIMAGILLQTGRVDLEATLAVCFCGVVLGDLIIYFIGRRFGLALFKKKWFKSKVPASRIKTMRLSLEKRSILMIFVARHLFYLRTATFLTCGAVRMNLRKFIVADSAAASISLPVMIGIGYLAAEHYESVLTWFEKARNITLVVIIAAILAFCILRLRRRGARAAVDQKKNISTEDEASQNINVG